MSTDTPRTDAAYYVVKNPREPGEGLNMVKADFARTLERELNAADCNRLKGGAK